MQLKELKNIWSAEKQELEGRIAINEKLVSDLASEKIRSSFDHMSTTSIRGRNLALVYMSTSIIAAATVFYDFEYSVPALIGAGLMLFSFFQHSSLKKPDYSAMSTLEFQKAIYRFRIHTAKYAKYDISIVSLWFLTVIPIYGKYVLQIELSVIELSAIIVSAIALTAVCSIYGYKKWDKQLQENEDQLSRLLEFEKN
jgi:hypothetical protein